MGEAAWPPGTGAGAEARGSHSVEKSGVLPGAGLPPSVEAEEAPLGGPAWNPQKDPKYPPPALNPYFELKKKARCQPPFCGFQDVPFWNVPGGSLQLVWKIS